MRVTAAHLRQQTNCCHDLFNASVSLSAVKAGDALSLAEQQALLDALSRAYSPAMCPHGRPALVSLRLAELEQRFLRR